MAIVLFVSLAILTARINFAEDPPGIDEVIEYGTPKQLGILANKKINESSGLAVSRIESGLLWTHNDSGDKPRIFAFDEVGRDRGEFHFPDLEANDWEDMASVTLDGVPHLILADVGDNARRRAYCTLHVIREPSDPKQPIDVRSIRFQYDDGPRDCEAIAMDPDTKQVVLVTKAIALRSPVYQLDWPELNSDDVHVAQRIGGVPLPLVTAMDIAASGRRAILATYANAYEFRRDGDEPWRAALSRPPRTIVMPERRQGESICYGQDSRTLYLTSEKTPTPLWRVAPRTMP